MKNEIWVPGAWVVVERQDNKVIIQVMDEDGLATLSATQALKLANALADAAHSVLE